MLSPQSSFAAYFFIQNLPRGMLLSVIPLQAYALMGNAQDTSLLLFAVSVGGIVAALTLPILIRRIGVYPSYLFSCAMMILSACLMMVEQVWVFSAGLFCHAFAIAAAEVTLSLYVMGRVARSQMTSFEPLAGICQRQRAHHRSVPRGLPRRSQHPAPAAVHRQHRCS